MLRCTVMIGGMWRKRATSHRWSPTRCWKILISRWSCSRRRSLKQSRSALFSSITCWHTSRPRLTPRQASTPTLRTFFSTSTRTSWSWSRLPCPAWSTKSQARGKTTCWRPSSRSCWKSWRTRLRLPSCWECTAPTAKTLLKIFARQTRTRESSRSLTSGSIKLRRCPSRESETCFITSSSSRAMLSSFQRSNQGLFRETAPPNTRLQVSLALGRTMDLEVPSTEPERSQLARWQTALARVPTRCWVTRTRDRHLSRERTRSPSWRLPQSPRLHRLSSPIISPICRKRSLPSLSLSKNHRVQSTP